MYIRSDAIRALCRGVLQYVAVCCSVLLSFVVCCSVLQCVYDNASHRLTKRALRNPTICSNLLIVDGRRGLFVCLWGLNKKRI